MTEPIAPESLPSAAPTPTPALTPAPAAAAAPPPPPRRDERPKRPQQRKSFKPTSVPTISDERAFGIPPKLSDLDAEIASELEAALAGVGEADLFASEAQKQSATPGEKGQLKGKVLRVHAPDVFIDVPGGRSQGVLPMMQFPDGVPEIGTEVDIHIEGYDRASGCSLLLRRGTAVSSVDWSSIAEGMIVEARVTGVNKGGLEVEVNGIRGFMPISQIDLFRVENTDQYINQRLVCMVEEVVPSERNLVVSRKAILEKERKEAGDKLWAELAEGQIREGIVRSVRDFGAFVDIGGADGLLHVSEMSWQRVKDPTTIVKPGQAVRVVVLKVDRETRKIGLGIKQLQDSPWDNVDQKYPHSTVVKGKISRIADFGAFVELEPGVEGLIHVSELAPMRVWRVKDIVQEGQEVQAMVLSVDMEQRRISLSLKAALPPEEPKAAVEEEDDEEIEVKPERPRTTPLRGGLGGG